MSRTRLSAERHSAVNECAALIAAAPARATIEEILASVGLGVAGFADVDTLAESAHEDSLALIVACADDATASSAQLIGPLTRRFAHTPIVLVHSRLSRREVRAALATGVRGIVLEGDLQNALAACVQAVRAGQICLPRHSWQQIEPPVLSAREKQVLGLLVMGHTNSQIADRLYLAESTVKSHLSSAFYKLGVRSRHEAVARILDPRGGLGIGILSLDSEPLQVGASPL
jgi:DNA-binding NarL/FixJ family response regulator